MTSTISTLVTECNLLSQKLRAALPEESVKQIALELEMLRHRHLARTLQTKASAAVQGAAGSIRYQGAADLASKLPQAIPETEELFVGQLTRDVLQGLVDRFCGKGGAGAGPAGVGPAMGMAGSMELQAVQGLQERRPEARRGRNGAAASASPAGPRFGRPSRASAAAGATAKASAGPMAVGHELASPFAGLELMTPQGAMQVPRPPVQHGVSELVAGGTGGHGSGSATASLAPASSLLSFPSFMAGHSGSGEMHTGSRPDNGRPGVLVGPGAVPLRLGMGMGIGMVGSSALGSMSTGEGLLGEAVHGQGVSAKGVAAMAVHWPPAKTGMDPPQLHTRAKSAAGQVESQRSPPVQTGLQAGSASLLHASSFMSTGGAGGASMAMGMSLGRRGARNGRGMSVGGQSRDAGFMLGASTPLALPIPAPGLGMGMGMGLSSALSPGHLLGRGGGMVASPLHGAHAALGSPLARFPSMMNVGMGMGMGMGAGLAFGSTGFDDRPLHMGPFGQGDHGSALAAGGSAFGPDDHKGMAMAMGLGLGLGQQAGGGDGPSAVHHGQTSSAAPGAPRGAQSHARAAPSSSASSYGLPAQAIQLDTGIEQELQGNGRMGKGPVSTGQAMYLPPQSSPGAQGAVQSSVALQQAYTALYPQYHMGEGEGHEEDMPQGRTRAGHASSRKRVADSGGPVPTTASDSHASAGRGAPGLADASLSGLSAGLSAGLSGPLDAAFLGDLSASAHDRLHGGRRTNLTDHAKSVLRAWFLGHTANPYPSESDKSELARKAGTSVEKVSNWFINARARDWGAYSRAASASAKSGKSLGSSASGSAAAASTSAGSREKASGRSHGHAGASGSAARPSVLASPHGHHPPAMSGRKRARDGQGEGHA